MFRYEVRSFRMLDLFLTSVSSKKKMNDWIIPSLYDNQSLSYLVVLQIN